MKDCSGDNIRDDIVDAESFFYTPHLQPYTVNNNDTCIRENMMEFVDKNKENYTGWIILMIYDSPANQQQAMVNLSNQQHAMVHLTNQQHAVVHLTNQHRAMRINRWCGIIENGESCRKTLSVEWTPDYTGLIPPQPTMTEIVEYVKKKKEDTQAESGRPSCHHSHVRVTVKMLSK
ncbi:hypothetical protein CBL_07713 [Carabus blaptoides fortunei]